MPIKTGLMFEIVPSLDMEPLYSGIMYSSIAKEDEVLNYTVSNQDDFSLHHIANNTKWDAGVYDVNNPRYLTI